MKNLSILFSVCAAAFAVVNTQASIFISESTFLANVGGHVTVDFAGNVGAVANNTSFGNATYSAQISGQTADSLYNDYSALFDTTPSASITINGFSSPVTAVGAYFYATDGSVPAALANGSIAVTYTDSTGPLPAQNITLLAGDMPYRGFTAPGGATISSVVFTGGTTWLNTIDSLTLGAAAVPEPSVWGFCVGSGLVVFGAYRRMRK